MKYLQDYIESKQTALFDDEYSKEEA